MSTRTHNQLLIDMLLDLSKKVAKVNGIGGTRDWLVAELSVIISHAQDGPELDAHPSQTDEELYKQAMDDVTPEALERMDKRLAAIDAQTEDLEARAREFLQERNLISILPAEENEQARLLITMLAAFARTLNNPRTR